VTQVSVFDNFSHYALEISYDGGVFNGWQSQPNGGGVQDAVERALFKLGECSGQRVKGAGRTDSGVHAKAQVASVVLSKGWEPRRLKLALNARLPRDISVMRAAVVPTGFNARKDAISREYRYFIWNSSVCYPHLRPFVLHKPGNHYDWRRASIAARMMKGTHDFSAFCRKADCPESAVRTVIRSTMTMRGNLIVFRVEANAFLTNMVRIMAGNLLEIAKNRFDETWLKDLLSGRSDRTASAGTLPPSGLFLWQVKYPEKIDWA
jgi:tRNA pseudouridine38-40 synthase